MAILPLGLIGLSMYAGRDEKALWGLSSLELGGMIVSIGPLGYAMQRLLGLRARRGGVRAAMWKADDGAGAGLGAGHDRRDDDDDDGDDGDGTNGDGSLQGQGEGGKAQAQAQAQAAGRESLLPAVSAARSRSDERVGMAPSAVALAAGPAVTTASPLRSGAPAVSDSCPALVPVP